MFQSKCHFISIFELFCYHIIYFNILSYYYLFHCLLSVKQLYSDCIWNRSIIIAIASPLSISVSASMSMLLPLVERKRIYIVGVKFDGSVTSQSPEEFFDDLGALLETLKVPPLPIERVLLQECDPSLQTELERRKKFKEEQDAKVNAGEIVKESCVCMFVFSVFK